MTLKDHDLIAQALQHATRYANDWVGEVTAHTGVEFAADAIATELTYDSGHFDRARFLAAIQF